MKEYNNPADQLIEAIRQWHKRTTGEDLTNKEIIKKVTDIVKERLND